MKKKKMLEFAVLNHMMLEEYNEKTDTYYNNNLVIIVINGHNGIYDKITNEVYDIFDTPRGSYHCNLN
jgi:regulator of sigma D